MKIALGALGGMLLAVGLTLVPPWIQGTGFYEWQDSLVWMGVPLVLTGAVVGALLPARSGARFGRKQ